MLSTEECNEAYLDVFDSLIVLNPSQERLGYGAAEVVPAFSAVYHGATALFGNYALPDGIPPFDPLWPDQERWKDEKEWHKLFPDQFYAEMARTVIWGMQPTVCNLQQSHTTDARFQAIYEFICQTAKFYYANRDFLYDGEMLSPGSLETDTINVEFMSRMIFTKEDEYRVVAKSMPAILHSRWQAPDGRRALVLANYSAVERHFAYQSDTLTVSGQVIAPHSYQLTEY